MGKLVDTDELYVAFRRDIMGGLNYDRILREAKPVDAVPVVRCKDCKHYQFADNRAFGFPVKRCEWTGFEDVDDEDFCSEGERKEGDYEKAD